MKIAMTGASGFLGSACRPALEAQGHQIIRLVRRVPGVGEARWDPENGTVEANKLAGIDAAIHFAGENIGGLWTKQKKRRILESRKNGTRTLCKGLAALDPRPRVLISISGVNYYGDRGEEILTEESSSDDSFLSIVCREWESATAAAFQAGIRVAIPRLGVVLSRKGGALRQMMIPFKLGLGAKFGSGKQWMSWIALEDVVSMIQYVLENDSITGSVNATSPNPIRNRDFTAALARSLHRPAFLTIPAFALRVLPGKMAQELILASTRAVPDRLLKSGFRFKRDNIEEALQ
ncbi:MAG TPA: TIGR01777 family oxidoreductase [Fimbriimonadales bacterium]|jgi:uncharacterized protein (TIGR01777 family)|nr:TIGR01777 family oxidoreductase [Fimbriimonadales bacterium]